LITLLKNKINILIAEDDKLSNESLRLLLEDILSEKYEIHSLYSGELVVEEIEKNKYDIVFLDNNLPGKNGISILKELKNRNIQTNVIFLTGFSDEEIAVKAMKLGAKDFIAKGYLDVPRLIEAINEIVIDSCSIREISPEILSKLQSHFIVKDELVPRQAFLLKYGDDEPYEKEIIEALEVLHKQQYVEKDVLFSTVVCPICESVPGEMYLSCPICNSLELIKGEVIEHKKCRHIDFKTNLVDKDGKLVCTKCGDRLKQIGVDYIKVGINYMCNKSHIFPSPEHMYRCTECGKEFSEDDSKIVNIYKYMVSDEGKTSMHICDAIKDPHGMKEMVSV